MSDCLPCDLESADAAGIVYRDDDWACEIATGYEVPGWFFLRLRRHAEGWAEPTVDELGEFGPVSKRIAAAIQAATGASHVYFLSFGENYPHFHFLVIARDAELDAAFRGAAILGLRAEGLDVAASLAVAERVRGELAGAASTA